MAKHCSDYMYLPNEILLTEIFPRLPAKDVAKCRCLSKEWRTKLSTSEFIYMHLHCQIDQQQNTLLLETRGEVIHCTLPLRSANNSFLSKTFELQFTYEGFKIANTCNGLVLLHNNHISEMLLVNPITQQQLTIPNSPLRKSNAIISPALGYDGSAMDYKIVHLTAGNDPFFVHVYSVKMGIWQRYDFPLHGAILYPSPAVVVLNGVIHWCVPVCIPGRLKYVISSFELAGEVFGEMSLPGKTIIMGGPYVLGECLCILNTESQGGTCVTDLWVMKNYGEHNSWVKLATWQFDLSRYEPLYLNDGDDEILLRTEAGAFAVFNLKEQNAIDVVVDGIEGPFFAAHTFVKSLVSPIPADIAV